MLADAFSGTFDFLSKLNAEHPELIPAALVAFALGAFCTLTLCVLVYRRKHRKQAIALGAKTQQIKQLSQALERKTSTVAESEHTRKVQLGEIDRLNKLARRQRTRLQECCAEIKTLTHQLDTILQSDGRIWESATVDPPPPFRTRGSRATIISVASVKGGVGKTTITANLAASLASTGDRVLAIDLDYQASLTNLCFKPQRRENLVSAGRLVENLFQPGGSEPKRLIECVEQIDDARELFGVATTESLVDCENRAMARWMASANGADVRFLLRRVLHATEIGERYDWILLDCPPRWTTASVNALAASDYCLIPVILDPTSIDAVPRMLRWLAKMKHGGVCSDISLLGILANKTNRAPSLTTSEQNSIEDTREKCSPRWMEPVHIFSQHVPARADFKYAANENRMAADNGILREIFQNIVEEIKQRAPSYEG